MAGGRRGGAAGSRAGPAAARRPAPLPYPSGLGRWPAAAAILAFAWVELVYANRDDPSQLAIMALAYAAVQLIGMSLYGVEAWSRRGDAFGVYFGLFARSRRCTGATRRCTCARRCPARRRSTPVPGPSRCCAR